MVTTTTRPACPECGAAMRQTRRGATLAKRGPSYLCPINESELVPDERYQDGRRRRVDGSQHAYLRVWQEWEL